MVLFLWFHISLFGDTNYIRTSYVYITVEEGVLHGDSRKTTTAVC